MTLLNYCLAGFLHPVFSEDSDMEKKFTALRIVGSIYKALGIISGLFTILMIVLIVIGGASSLNNMYGGMGVSGAGSLGMLILVVLVFIFGAIYSISIYGFGELIFLLVGLEENTRFTAILLRDRIQRV
jgi:hypothetical protein